MPDISKINALAIGSVSKVDGLAKASILDIDGVTVPSAYTGLLDETYGSNAAAAYSVRLLRAAYKTGGGSIMRVRRDVDNVEADVGFDSNNELGLTSPISNTSDAQSYTDFADFMVVSGVPRSGFVRYWYDQSGNGVDAGQATQGSQPQIYGAGGIIEEGAAGKEKPALSCAGSTALNFDLSTSVQSGGYWHSFHVMQSTDAVAILMSSQTDGNMYYAISQGTTTTAISGGFVTTGGSNTYAEYWKNGTQPLSSGATRNDITNTFYTGNQLLMNFMATTSSGRNVTDMRLADYATSGFGYTGTLQEVIIYQSDKSGNRSDIEDNLNGYFQIY